MDGWMESLKEILFVRRRRRSVGRSVGRALFLPPAHASAARSSPSLALSALILHHSQFGRLDPFSDYASQESPSERGKEGRKKGGRKQAGEQGTVDDRSNEGGGPHHRGKTADVAHRLLLPLLLRRVLGKK